MAQNDETPPSKTIGTLFLVIGGVSVVALIIIAARIGTAAVPLCDTGFPGRQGQFPTWVFVFTAIAAFALGHATGTDRAGPKRQAGKELGEGQWQSPNAVIAVNAGVAGVMFFVAEPM